MRVRAVTPPSAGYCDPARLTLCASRRALRALLLLAACGTGHATKSGIVTAVADASLVIADAESAADERADHGAVLQLRASLGNVAAIFADGSMQYWGNTSDVDCPGHTCKVIAPTPVAPPHLSHVKAVAPTWAAMCVMEDDGPHCWGQYVHLVDMVSGLEDPIITIAAPSLAPFASALDVHAGPVGVCFLMPGGTDQCWGENSAEAYPVPGLAGLSQMQLGSRHGCGVDLDGHVRCWNYSIPDCTQWWDGWAGNNAYGELGTGDTASVCGPVQVKGLTDVATLATGSWNTCAVKTDGTVWCWGSNGSGSLGLPADHAPHPLAAAVPGINDAVAVSSSDHTCVVRKTGDVWCWGYNYDGQLGRATPDSWALPAPVPGIHDAKLVAAGAVFTCVARADDSIWCWGKNDQGQLGDGTRQDSLIPVKVVP